MSEFIFLSVDSPPEHFISSLQAALSDYNDSKGGRSTIHRLGFCANDKDGYTQGAIYGWLEWGWLFINLLWVEENSRGKGLGTQLLQRIENRAIELGVNRAYLETGCFQAPDFYKNQGYQVISTMPITADNRQPFIKYTMCKEFNI